MARYRIAVCDDEPSELEDIVQSVKRYDVHGDFDIENYTDGAVLLSDLQLKKNFFDLLLLDIEMPSNGFQIAQTLTQMEKHPLVIFVTKRHEYAVQGYGIAFRYLVKPLDKSLFTAAMDAVVQELDSKHFTVEYKNCCRLSTDRHRGLLLFVPCSVLLTLFHRFCAVTHSQPFLFLWLWI